MSHSQGAGKTAIRLARTVNKILRFDENVTRQKWNFLEETDRRILKGERRGDYGKSTALAACVFSLRQRIGEMYARSRCSELAQRSSIRVQLTIAGSSIDKLTTRSLLVWLNHHKSGQLVTIC